MSEEKRKPTPINKATSNRRFIEISIDTKKINKDWLFVSETGSVRLNMTLMMLPDGEVDQYGNLGMIVQKVPKTVYEKDKTAKGVILGNGAEFSWAVEPEKPGDESGKMGAASLDDLPF